MKIVRIFRYLHKNLKKLCGYISIFFQTSVAGSCLCPRWLRFVIYRLFGNKVHTTHINARCFIGGSNLYVGKNSFINFDNFFDLTDKITIGNNVHIAMKSVFITSTHKVESEFRRAGKGISQPIVIEDGCWIGGNVTILPGVTVGHGTIIGAGAVVIKDCEPNSVYAGVPAKKIKTLPVEIKQEEIL